MSKRNQLKSLPLCECGCGAETKGGRFVPGHDAKLKKTLIESALGGSKRAEAKLENLGWTKFLDAKREKQSVTKASRKVGAKPRRRATQPKAATTTEGAEAEHRAGSDPVTADATGETAPPVRRRSGRPPKVRPNEGAAPATAEAGKPTTPE